MTQKPVTGGVFAARLLPSCDAQDRFLETTFADMLELGMREPLDGAYLCRHGRRHENGIPRSESSSRNRH